MLTMSHKTNVKKRINPSHVRFKFCTTCCPFIGQNDCFNLQLIAPNKFKATEAERFIKNRKLP